MVNRCAVLRGGGPGNDVRVNQTVKVVYLGVVEVGDVGAGVDDAAVSVGMRGVDAVDTQRTRGWW